MSVNLRSFKQKARHRKTKFVRFLSRLRSNPPAKLDHLAITINKEIWKEVDCATCANCCKTMSPTYTAKDIKRIASHFEMAPKEFRLNWLVKDRQGDWLNKSTPCQFLNIDTNKCGIYDIRPADCVSFPHITKKKMVEYIHIHQQNVDSCPATYKMVELMMMFLHEKR